MSKLALIFPLEFSEQTSNKILFIHFFKSHPPPFRQFLRGNNLPIHSDCFRTKTDIYLPFSTIKHTSTTQIYSTVTDLAKLRGLSTSVPLNTATWYESSCNGIV